MNVISKKRTRSGHGVADRTWFEMTSDEKPTVEQVAEIQRELGYHPAGYGGPDGISTTDDGSNFVTVWCCWSSCD